MQQQRRNRPARRASDSVCAPPGFDPITGVATRALFRARVEQEWQRAAQSKRLVAVIMFSIDRFRECGGAAAAICQQAVAEVIATHCRRRADFVGRMRDHEFAILLSGATRQGARQLAEAIRKAIEAQQLKPAAGDWALTVSCGVAGMVPRPTRFVDALLIAADAGLREARRMGGNTVRASSALR
ncbi:MAG TPA: GGDEF domain-containing protein [Nevskiales bacterium]|nr:GGDEF domain-containing protein [Nevskiales bacterium]